MGVVRKILVGYDGSEGARRALRYGAELAREQQADLWAVAVLEDAPPYAARNGEGQDDQAGRERTLQQILLLEEAYQEVEQAGVQLQLTMRRGQAAQAVVAVAEEGAFDLVVIGHSGRSAVWGRFLGATADTITDRAPCSVLVVR